MLESLPDVESMQVNHTHTHTRARAHTHTHACMHAFIYTCVHADAESMQEVTAAEVGIMFDSPDRRPKLQRVFDLLSRPNAAGERVLGRAEFLRLARLIDPTLAKADAAAEAAVWDRVREGKDELAFADVDRISVSGALNMVHSGRFYVALSLDEAEHLRAVMHMYRTLNLPLLAQLPAAPAEGGGTAVTGAPRTVKVGTAVGLRALTRKMEGILLDASLGYKPAPPLQELTAVAALRFLDSQLFYPEPVLGSLVRAVQLNSREERQAFFSQVPMCRLCMCLYGCIHVYIHTCVCVYIYIYIYR